MFTTRTSTTNDIIFTLFSYIYSAYQPINHESWWDKEILTLFLIIVIIIIVVDVVVVMVVVVDSNNTYLLLRSGFEVSII